MLLIFNHQRLLQSIYQTIKSLLKIALALSACLSLSNHSLNTTFCPFLEASKIAPFLTTTLTSDFFIFLPR
jgi:hypothetical protein